MDMTLISTRDTLGYGSAWGPIILGSGVKSNFSFVLQKESGADMIIHTH